MLRLELFGNELEDGVAERHVDIGDSISQDNIGERLVTTLGRESGVERAVTNGLHRCRESVREIEERKVGELQAAEVNRDAGKVRLFGKAEAVRRAGRLRLEDSVDHLRESQQREIAHPKYRNLPVNDVVFSKNHT